MEDEREPARDGMQLPAHEALNGGTLEPSVLPASALATAPIKRVLAKGRNPEEFYIDGKLPPAEARLVLACQRGEVADQFTRTPRLPDESDEIVEAAQRDLQERRQALVAALNGARWFDHDPNAPLEFFEEHRLRDIENEPERAAMRSALLTERNQANEARDRASKEFHALAAEMLATSRENWLSRDLVPARRRQLLWPDEIAARVDAQPAILRDLLLELPSFAYDHLEAPPVRTAAASRPEWTHDAPFAAAASAKADDTPSAPRNWMAEGAAWRPVIEALISLFEREAEGWRRVAQDDEHTRVRADVLRFLAMGGDASHPVHEVGVQLRGAYVSGPMDLTGAANVVRLDLAACRFAEHVTLDSTRIDRLWLGGSFVPGISAVRANINGTVHLGGGFRCEGEARLLGVRIAGALECQGGTFRNRTAGGDGIALMVTNAKIGGHVLLSDGFASRGLVNFGGAEIDDDLICNLGTFSNRNADGSGMSLAVHMAKIAKNVSLSEGFAACGRVLLVGTQIGGSLRAMGCKISNYTPSGTGEALNAASAKIGGFVVLATATIGAGKLQSFEARGQVSFAYAEIGSNVECMGGKFVNRTEVADGTALNFTNAHIRGNLLLSDLSTAAISSPGFQAEGVVSLVNAKISGGLSCDGGSFLNRTPNGDGVALMADGATIGGDVSLGKPFIADGQVSLSKITIGGGIHSHGTFRNGTADGSGVAIDLQRAKITASCLLTYDFNAQGKVDLLGVWIGGNFMAGGGTFDNLAPLEYQDADQTSAARKARRPKMRAATALDVSNARIDGTLGLCRYDDGSTSPPKIRGSVDLSLARVRHLADDFDRDRRGKPMPAGWPKPIDTTDGGQRLRCDIELDGFVYDGLSGRAPTSAQLRLSWLSQMPPLDLAANFRPQPFAQLARVLIEMGHGDEAKAIQKEADRLHTEARMERSKLRVRGQRGWRRAPRWVAELPTRFGLTIRRLVLDKALGGGFSATAPLVTLLALLLGFGLYYQREAEHGWFVPANPAVWSNPDVRRACADSDRPPPPVTDVIDWYRCRVHLPDLPKLYPLAYSFDLMIPYASIGQKTHWRPREEIVRELAADGRTVDVKRWTWLMAATWVQSILAPVLYALLAALAAGWIKRD